MPTYKDAGVDIKRVDTAIEHIKKLAGTTKRKGTFGDIGQFAAFFDPKAAGYSDPILVTSTDGVGTKLKIAIESGIHHTIGIDLVAMCVNDIVVHGAEPLQFLDYYATGRFEPTTFQTVIEGIVEGCRLAGCELAGGETAEMPGMFNIQDEYELAGFAVGALERGTKLPYNIKTGDKLIGLGSSGLHANGFSLVRQVLPEDWKKLQFLVLELLTPTRIYVQSILAMHHEALLQGAAHITGGGLIGNLPRILPEGIRAVFDNPWFVPSIFTWLHEEHQIGKAEMLRTFNCGIGVVLVVRPDFVKDVVRIALQHDERPIFLGYLEEGEEHKIDLPSDKWWMPPSQDFKSRL